MSNENFKENQQQPSPQKGYKDDVHSKDIEQRTMAPSLPKAPDPSPFVLGGGGGQK